MPELKELLEKYPTYEDWSRIRQEEVNALPMHWAFGKAQFDLLCEELGAQPEDFIQSKALGGALILEKDWPAVKAFFEQPDEVGVLLGDYEWAKGAFLYEMGNHEYHINWQGDWDVMHCFTDIEYRDEDAEGYLKRLDWADDTKRAYRDARREYYKACDENGWW